MVKNLQLRMLGRNICHECNRKLQFANFDNVIRKYCKKCSHFITNSRDMIHGFIYVHNALISELKHETIFTHEFYQVKLI